MLQTVMEVEEMVIGDFYGSAVKRAVGQDGSLSGFLEGYLMPHAVQAKLIAQEPLLERVSPDSEYIRRAWQDAFGALGAAMMQYAEEN